MRWIARHLGPARGDDRGSALVAALAVAIIGFALAAVVVSQAVAVSNASGRDRARTIQVHGAEGAVDAMYAALETGTPCAWPATGTALISTAPDQTDVKVAVKYYDASSNLLTCSAGTVTGGVPSTAVITARADTVQLPAAGTTPHRTIEAKVQLTPQDDFSFGAAIYSASAGVLTNNFTASSADVDTSADIWIDSGNVDCNSSVSITGRLFVPAGTVSMSNNCTITKDLSIQPLTSSATALQMNQGTVQGDVWIYRGNATLNGASAHIGGNLTTAGTATNGTGGAVAPLVGGVVKTGWVPSGPLVRVALPHVGYTPSDWTGFATNTFGAWAQSSSLPGSDCKTTLSSCNTIASYSWSIGAGQALTSTSVPTLYDARAQNLTFQNTTIVLNADTVIFAKSATFTNTVNVRSGNGLPHKLWIIVPYGASCSGSSGNISVNSNINFDSDPAHGAISTFLYTPCTAEISNYVNLRGQIYGGIVNLRNNLTVLYTGVGVPGVNLWPSSSTSSTRVAIVYKREIAPS